MERENGCEKRFHTFIHHSIGQFIKFGFVGGINTVLTLVIQWIFLALGFHYLIGNGIAFVITVYISFLLNNRFVFKADHNVKHARLKALLKVYISYSFTGLFLNSLLLVIWNDLLGVNPNISPVVNLIFTVPLNFLLNKYWAYR